MPLIAKGLFYYTKTFLRPWITLRELNRCRILHILNMTCFLPQHDVEIQWQARIRNYKTISKYITNYIETEYKTAKLSELAKQLNSNIFQISRFIKSKFGQTFKEMLQNLTLDEFNSFINRLDISKNHISVVMTGVAK